jgi:hypothetical protein
VDREIEEARDWAYYWRAKFEESEEERRHLEEENASLATRLIQHDDILIRLLLERS